ncbi:hypothetical protein Trisim1_008495 [Trichoderma cf. simile WF8]
MANLSLDITNTLSNLDAHNVTCASPSWPRRATLSISDLRPSVSSLLSDDDLSLCGSVDGHTHSETSPDMAAATSYETWPACCLASDKNPLPAREIELGCEKEGRPQVIQRYGTCGIFKMRQKGKLSYMPRITEEEELCQLDEDSIRVVQVIPRAVLR